MQEKTYLILKQLMLLLLLSKFNLLIKVLKLEKRWNKMKTYLTLIVQRLMMPQLKFNLPIEALDQEKILKKLEKIYLIWKLLMLQLLP